MKIGTKVVTTRKENFNGTVVLKGVAGVVVAVPTHRTDMVSVKFAMATILFPKASLKVA